MALHNSSTSELSSLFTYLHIIMQLQSRLFLIWIFSVNRCDMYQNWESLHYYIRVFFFWIHTCIITYWRCSWQELMTPYWFTGAHKTKHTSFKQNLFSSLTSPHSSQLNGQTLHSIASIAWLATHHSPAMTSEALNATITYPVSSSVNNYNPSLAFIIVLLSILMARLLQVKQAGEYS